MTIKDISYTVVIVLLGAVFILLGTVGGFTVGVYTIPTIELWARILMAIIGLALLGGSVILELKTRVASKAKANTVKTNEINSPKPQGLKVDISRNETKPIPEIYHFPFIKEQVESRYGSQASFLVVQYGSSVRDHGAPNDQDYLVLVYGNHYEEDSVQEETGHSRKPTAHMGFAIDYHIRLFDSFLIGLIMGKPYEVSAAIDGKVRGSQKFPEEYWEWMKVLSSNLMIDTQYLVERLYYDLQTHRERYVIANKSNWDFYFIIPAYHYVCCLVQINCLKKYPKKVPTVLIYPLSQTKFLRQQIESGEALGLFDEVVDYFKRNKQPSDKRKFENDFDRLGVLLGEDSHER